MKKVTVLILLLPSIIFASAYFYGNTIQYLNPQETLNGQLYFSAYKESEIYLEIYRVNISAVDFLKNLLYNTINKKELIFLKTEKYTITQKHISKKIILPPKTGIYFLKITNSNKFLASTYVFISEIKLININDGEEKYLYLRSTKDGSPVKNAAIFLTTRSSKIVKLNLKNGFINVSKYEYSNVYACTNNSLTTAYNYSSPSSLFAVYITTDRPVYRPGQKVNFKGYFLQNLKNSYKSISDQEMEVKISDPNGTIIYDKKSTTNEFGTLNGSLYLPKSAYLGYYSIKFYYGKYHFSGGFIVQAYKKPTFYITIKSDKEEYIYRDNMNYTISLKYFNDQPVVNAKASVYVYADSNNYGYYNQSSKLLYYNSLTTNSKGIIKLPITLSEKMDGDCRIEVVASDETQREIDKTYSVKIYQGNIRFKFDKPYYSVKPNKEFNVGFKAFTLKGTPLSGTIQATFCGKRYTAKVKNGVGKLRLKTTSIGNFPLLIKFKDCLYHAYIYSYEFAYMNYEPKDVTIFTDKKEYSPTEKIKVVIYSPHKIYGLLILGGERIYHLETLDTSSNSIIKNVLIPKDIAEQNAWIIYIPFSSSNQQYYDHELLINLNNAKLKINLSTDKKIYKPKDMVHLHIKTNKNTDLAISVVDKSIYAIVSQNSNIFDELYPKSNYPDMEISFSSKYIPYDMISKIQTPNIFSKTKKDYKFASFKTKQAVKKNVRKYFPDTALWIPSKILKNGECNIDFRLPDSITSWRIRAVGIDKEMKVGEGSTDIVSTKYFYVQPILPMFFREGDNTRIGVTIFNNTDKATRAILSIKTSNSIKLKDNSKIEFNLQPHSSKTFFKECDITYASSEASITIDAQTSKMKDTVLWKVKVLPYTLNRKLYNLFLLSNETKEITISNLDYYNLKINLYSSFKPIIKDSLKRLISYPYGCVEQTMSSFFPAIVAKSYQMNFKNLDDIIHKGLIKLFAYQHLDGGWGWWSRDKSIPWMTEYVLNGLYYAKNQGYDIPQNIISNAISYIKKHIDGYGTYVLSLYGIKSNYEAKNVIDEIYLSYTNKNYLKPLLARMLSKNSYSYLDIKSDDFFTTNVQLNSIFLQSLIKWKEDPKIINRVVRYVLYKKDGEFWYDTKDTAFAVIALMKYDKNVRIDLKLRNIKQNMEFKTPQTVYPKVYGKYTFAGTGIVEIGGEYKEVPKTSVDEGIEINREIFKRLEIIGTDPKGKKNIIDAILPITGKLEPVSIKAYKYDRYFVYNGKLYLKYFEDLDDYSFDLGTYNFSISDKGLKINGKSVVIGRIETIKGNTKELLISTKMGLYIYNYRTAKFYKMKGLIDADTNGNITTLLSSNTLIIEGSDYKTIIKLSKNYRGVDIVKNNIYLLGDYISILKDNKIQKLYPISGDFIFNTDKNGILLGGNVKFVGNSETVGPLGLYLVKFESKRYDLKVGDIVMVRLNVKCTEGKYVIVEDYFPSCAQVLNKYSERRFTGSYKLDYLWYNDWNYWYLSKQLRDDKIGFFAYYFTSGTITYYYRLTTQGIYKTLPAQSYTMYHKGIYGQSDPNIIVVH